MALYLKQTIRVKSYIYTYTYKHAHTHKYTQMCVHALCVCLCVSVSHTQGHQEIQGILVLLLSISINIQVSFAIFYCFLKILSHLYKSVSWLILQRWTRIHRAKLNCIQEEIMNTVVSNEIYSFLVQCPRFSGDLQCSVLIFMSFAGIRIFSFSEDI